MKKYISASSNWNNGWRDNIPGEVRARLSECRNTWQDIEIMGRAMKLANPDKSVDECAERILDWVLDWNDQYDLDPSLDQYEELLRYIEEG